MKTIYKLSIICSFLLLFFSCRREEDLNLKQPVGLGGDVWAQGPIDKWIKDNLTSPYNIAVKYRWDPWDLSLNKDLTPPDESKIIDAMAAVKKVWIDPYTEETGSELFIKKYAPKQFVLVGSVEYNSNGTVKLGQAEGGNNITFFDINQNFDKNNVSSIKRMIHTSHHEFAHILHQTVMYPSEFKFITKSLGLAGYTATWFNVSAADALANGYITPYSMASYDEDFVEMASTMLVEGKGRFNEIVASANEVAQEALRAKEQIVVTYFREVWNIDFYSLQRKVQTALNTLIPPPAVADVYGLGKTYTRASVNPANQTLLPQPGAFMSIYNTTKSSLAGVGGAGRVLDSFAVVHNSASTIMVRMYYRNAAGSAFQANYQFAYSKDAAGLYTFTLNGYDNNGNTIFSGVTSLLGYFNNNKFTLEWYADPSVTIYPRIRFKPQAIPDTYFIARLLL